MSTNGDTAVDRDIVSPLESRAASPQPVYPRTILNDNGPSNMSMEAPEHQRATLNHGQPYAGPTQARNFDDFTKHKVQHRDPVNARPILRATSLMLCAVVLATNIAEYTVIYTGTRYSYYFGGPDLLTGVPVAFLTFVWELADFITTWSRGRGIHPRAHIVVELILGLGALVCALFTGWALYRSVHWYSRGRSVVSIGPESVQVTMLALLVGICLSLHVCAIRDNTARGKALDLKFKTMEA